MENPPPSKPSEPAPSAETWKQRQARAAELKRNREVGHLLKGGGFRPHQAPRSMPHMRGR